MKDNKLLRFDNIAFLLEKCLLLVNKEGKGKRLKRVYKGKAKGGVMKVSLEEF